MQLLNCTACKCDRVTDESGVNRAVTAVTVVSRKPPSRYSSRPRGTSWQVAVQPWPATTTPPRGGASHTANRPEQPRLSPLHARPQNDPAFFRAENFWRFPLNRGRGSLHARPGNAGGFLASGGGEKLPADRQGKPPGLLARTCRQNPTLFLLVGGRGENCRSSRPTNPGVLLRVHRRRFRHGGRSAGRRGGCRSTPPDPDANGWGVFRNRGLPRGWVRPAGGSDHRNRQSPWPRRREFSGGRGERQPQTLVMADRWPRTWMPAGA